MPADRPSDHTKCFSKEAFPLGAPTGTSPPGYPLGDLMQSHLFDGSQAPPGGMRRRIHSDSAGETRANVTIINNNYFSGPTNVVNSGTAHSLRINSPSGIHAAVPVQVNATTGQGIDLNQHPSSQHPLRSSSAGDNDERVPAASRYPWGSEQQPVAESGSASEGEGPEGRETHGWMRHFSMINVPMVRNTLSVVAVIAIFYSSRGLMRTSKPPAP